MNQFAKKIQAMWPDPAVEGWMEVHLECGHVTHQPKGNTNKTCHCGTCQLNHQAHLREVAAIQKKLEAEKPKEAGTSA